MAGELSLLLAEPEVLIALGVVLAAAIVRGFAGFGAGMIYVPIAAALFDPRTAAATILLFDIPIMIPFAWRLMPQANLREIGWLLAGAAVMTPLGTYALMTVDPVPVRWAVSSIILVAVTLIAAGWRYRAKIGVPGTLAVGGSAGFLNGLAQVGGPPLILFWMGQAAARHRMRANATLFFTVGTFISIVSFVTAGLITERVLWMSLLFAPVYAVGILIGNRLFHIASEVTYRRIAYAIVAVSGLLGLPLFDALF